MSKKSYLENELQSLLNKDNKIFNFIDEASLDGIWYWDLEKPKYKWMSPKLWTVLGYDPKTKKHLTSEWQDIIFQEDLEKEIENFNKHIEDPNCPYDQLVRYKHKNGSTIWIRCRGIIIRNEQGKATRMLGAHNDVSEIMNLKQNAENQEKFLKTLLENAPLPIFYKDKEGCYLDINKAWEELVGINKEDVIGKKVNEFAPKGIYETCMKQDKKIFNNQKSQVRYETKIKNKKTNKELDVMFYKSAHINDKGETIGIIGSILDLTHIKELETEHEEQEKILLAQSKVAALGEMIGNISHQWRQPLNIITTIASSIKLSTELKDLEEENVLRGMTQINIQAQHLSKTIDDFRNFFKSNIDEIGEFNIKDSLEKVYNLTKDSLNNNFITYQSNIIDYSFYKNENIFIQALINIINNAKDAIIDNTIDTENRFLFINAKKVNDSLIISIKDSGGGIQEDVIHRIFEPYFTTKGETLGTGIGLYMTNQIITKHYQGHIDVNNIDYEFQGKKLRGAEFHVVIPLP